MLIAAHTLDTDSGSDQVYNAFDTTLTHEIFSALVAQRPQAEPAYSFELALQAPVLEMMLRGFRVDPAARELGIQSVRAELLRLDQIIQTLAHAVWDKPLNPNSGMQLKDFFYNHLAVMPVKSWVKGELKFPMTRETLEKIDDYFQARPFTGAIMAHRDLAKQLEVLETEVDPDWRMRASYNIGGTNEGRFSSSKSPTGSGRNIQNITEDLRHIFVADPGMVLCGIDASQSDSRMVGFMCGLLFDDWSYLDACESSDLHTAVARMVWPELPWTGEAKADRKVADRPYYRHFPYRDICKKLGHACLTTDHEVLTENGWVAITDKPRRIMQFNPATGQSSFATVNTWVDQPWEGDFCEWNNLSISTKMTSTHRVYYTTTPDEALCVTHANKVPSSARIPLGWGYVGGKGSGVTPEVARVIAAYQCDGHYGGVGKQARFHMKEPRKFARLEDIAREAGVEFSQGEDKTKAALTIEDIKHWPKKAGAYLLSWTKDALEAYLHELVFWDGHYFESGSTKSTSLSSIDKDHLDWIRTCNRIVGKGGNISGPTKSGFGFYGYRLQINNRHFTNVEPGQRIVSYESNRVLCPSVPTEAFYIRRNGKISVTGNTNFLGKAQTLSRILRIPIALVSSFQERYFTAFPCIQRWQTWTAAELQTKQQLVSIHGRRRDFFDRTSADETIRAALAFLAASATADNLNLGMWRIWHHMPEVQLLAQVHDAVYFQFSERLDKNAIVRKAKKLLETDIVSPGGRHFIVPTEAKLGYNWGNYVKADGEKDIPERNVRGLRKWT